MSHDNGERREGTSAGDRLPDGVVSMMDRVRDILTVDRVVGTAIERDGVTLIPVAAVRGGGGGGGGEGQSPDDSDAQGSGAGVGFGVSAHPVGAYVMKDGSVSWQPAVDPVRMGMIFVAFSYFLFRWLTARGRHRG